MGGGKGGRMSLALSLAWVRPTPPEVAEPDGAVRAGIGGTLTLRPERVCVTDNADGRRDARVGPSTCGPGGTAVSAAGPAE